MRIPGVAWDDAPTHFIEVNLTWVGYVLGAVAGLLGTWDGTDSEVEAADEQLLQLLAAIATGLEVDVIPVGSMMMWPSNVAPPTGWLLCQGQALIKNDYPELYAAIFDAHGEDATTFNLPDMRLRVPVGAGFRVADNTFYGVGVQLGEWEHALTVDELPAHDHRSPHRTIQFGSQEPITTSLKVDTGAVKSAGFLDTTDTGGNQAHNNMQPSLFTQYIIKALP